MIAITPHSNLGKTYHRSKRSLVLYNSGFLTPLLAGTSDLRIVRAYVSQIFRNIFHMKISKINFTLLPLLHWYRAVWKHSKLILTHLSKSDYDSDSYFTTIMFNRCEKLINLEKFGVIKPKKQAQTFKREIQKKQLLLFFKNTSFT